MKHLKGIQRTLLCSALAVLAFGSAPAKAVTDTAFGNCVGAPNGATDCVAALGHISASVVGTLSINEMRAVSFGNFAVTCTGACDGKATMVLDPTGVRTPANGGGGDAFVLLNGANGGAGGGAGGETGSQSPGHYTVSHGQEGSATQVYISFSQTDGTGIDACSPHGSAAGGPYAGSFIGTPGLCDNYHPGSKVTLTGPVVGAFTVDQFVFNESGSDVFGHYIDDTAAVGPGIGKPFLPGHSSTGTPGGLGASQAIDVVVGATIHTVAALTPTPGKYTGQFDIMVSY